MAAPLVLLHGCTQTGRAWDGVRGELGLDAAQVHTPDLRGHGVRDTDRPVILPAMAADAMSAIPGPAGEFALGGYSMGGRVALLAAIASPGRVSHLALIATTAGIDDADARDARRVADADLADWIDAHSIEEVADRWASQPIFEGQPDDVLAAARDDRLRNTPSGIAAAVRGAGTGRMTSMWDQLGVLTMPVAVIVGERDEKYRAIADQLMERLPNAELTVVPGAGHQLPYEAPTALAAALTALFAR